jgi:hypothetical protein
MTMTRWGDGVSSSVPNLKGFGRWAVVEVVEVVSDHQGFEKGMKRV